MTTAGNPVPTTATRAAPERPDRINLLGLTRARLENYFQEIGERPFRAVQLLKWIHQQHVTEFSTMTNLSKALRTRLEQDAAIQLPEIVSTHESIDGTTKWLVRVASGNCIEMVFIPDEPRGTLCISSQVGCALNCTFCSTARQGFNRNLSSAEIIAQVWLARDLLENGVANKRAITNIVLMGMGEPLLNFDNVVDALDLRAVGQRPHHAPDPVAANVRALARLDRIGVERLGLRNVRVLARAAPVQAVGHVTGRTAR